MPSSRARRGRSQLLPALEPRALSSLQLREPTGDASWTNRRRAGRRDACARLDGLIVPLDWTARRLSSQRWVWSSQLDGGPQGAEQHSSSAKQSLLAARCI